MICSCGRISLVWWILFDKEDDKTSKPCCNMIHDISLFFFVTSKTYDAPIMIRPKRKLEPLQRPLGENQYTPMCVLQLWLNFKRYLTTCQRTMRKGWCTHLKVPGIKQNRKINPEQLKIWSYAISWHAWWARCITLQVAVTSARLDLLGILFYFWTCLAN